MKKKIHEPPLLSTIKGKTNSLQKVYLLTFVSDFFYVQSLFFAVNVTFKNPIFFEEEETIEREELFSKSSFTDYQIGVNVY